MACAVTRYDCAKHANTIQRLGQNANAQMEKNESFRNIFPWRAQCAEENVHFHYIARSPTGIICGWMTVLWKHEFGQHYVLIKEISTRRIKDELYGGVGQQLHAALLNDARDAHAEFIYLHPLNPIVAEVYKKWGYVTLRPEIVSMFLILTSRPNYAMLDSIMPPHPRTYIIAAHAIASRHPKDNSLLVLIDEKRRTMITQPEKMKELSDALDMIYGVEYMEDAENIAEEDRYSLDDKRTALREVFESVKVGGNRTRKQKRARSNTRKAYNRKS